MTLINILRKEKKKVLHLLKTMIRAMSSSKLALFLNRLDLMQGLLKHVANKLKTGKSAISRIENHAEDIRLSTLVNYAQALGKSLKLEVA